MMKDQKQEVKFGVGQNLVKDKRTPVEVNVACSVQLQVTTNMDTCDELACNGRCVKV